VQKVILILVIMAAVAIVTKPLIPFLNRSEQIFQVTPEPYAAYQQALASDKPIFLEFYADW
jgi:thiol:disulfide interchange protein